ncbi:MAG: 16S rRNA (adenine(1518)-N(6)/adenine(1519)-N(6))-dimethyltransferase RsmA [Candidatus Rokubacteria bacterium]|nr:16S rRNA (adenine(1518)-N(6)/adenine(1519)-N(6))-dimethyltransferase RsmA [Candidatus Rokubacteria bacterium]
MSPRRSPGALRRGVGESAGPRGPASGKTRALGQHFLHDPEVASRIVAIVGPTPRDLVIEIGPGTGALTGLLAGSGARLIALEVDGGLAARARERFAAWTGVEIRQADARHVDYAALATLRPEPGGRVLAVGNLPYSVGKPIVLALLAAGRAIDEMALMLQREVAERLAAAPGGKTYGALSVLTQVQCDVRVVLTVPPGAFRPPPQVESAVIHLRALPAPPVPIADPGRFRAVVKAAFAQRRKTLANSLAAGLGLPIEQVKMHAERAGIAPGRRAEALEIADFARLADLMSAM